MQILLFPEAEVVGLQKLAWCHKLFSRVPWSEWVEFVAPYYESAGCPDTACCSLEVMLRVHFVQQYLGLSDPAMACALQNQAVVRCLVGLSESGGAVPDENAIMRLRCLLELHAVPGTL